MYNVHENIKSVHNLISKCKTSSSHDTFLFLFSIIAFFCIVAIIGDIFIKTLTGKIVTGRLDMDQQVEDLMRIIQDKEGTPLDQQRLLSDGRQLDRYQTLAEQGISFSQNRDPFVSIS